MPRQPLFESQRKREWAIAALMLILLACTLGLAYLATKRQSTAAARHGWATSRQKVGTLQIEIPEGWTSRADASPATGFESFKLFAPAEEDGSRLLVGSLRFLIPRSPDGALALAQAGLRDQGSDFRRLEQMEVRAGLMVGKLLAEMESSPSGVVEHFLGVLTEDGRRYWVVYLRTPSPAGQTKSGLAGHFAAFHGILTSARDQDFRDANGGDFAAADLPSDDPTLKKIQGLGPRVSAGTGFDRPVSLVPVDSLGALRFFRVRGVADPGVDQVNHPLGPDTILRLQFLQVMNRAASAQEVARTKLGTNDAWHATFSPSVGAPTKLIRELWYTRTAPGKGLLIEIVTEPEGLASCRALLPRIVEELKRPEADTGGPQPPSAFEKASQRGVALAKGVLANAIRRDSPGATYYQIDAANTSDGPLGYRIDERLPAPNKATIAGQRLVVIHHERAVSARWEMSKDGRQFRWRQQWQTRRAAPGGEELLVQQELDLDGDHLRMIDVGAKRDAWVATLPDSYLGPMLDDTWVPDAPMPVEPAVLWASPEGNPPAACVVKSGVPTTGDAAVLVSWRPLLRMDADLLAFDSSGRLVRADITVPGSPAGEASRTLRRVSREELLGAFPKLKGDLERTATTQPKD